MAQPKTLELTRVMSPADIINCLGRPLRQSDSRQAIPIALDPDLLNRVSEWQDGWLVIIGYRSQSYLSDLPNPFQRLMKKPEGYHQRSGKACDFRDNHQPWNSILLSVTRCTTQFCAAAAIYAK